MAKKYEPGSYWKKYEALCNSPAWQKVSQANELSREDGVRAGTGNIFKLQPFFTKPGQDPKFLADALTYTDNPKLHTALFNEGRTLDEIHPTNVAMSAANILAIVLSSGKKPADAIRRNEWAEKVHETGILKALMHNTENPSEEWQTRGFSTVAIAHAGAMHDPARKEVEEFLLKQIKSSLAKGGKIGKEEAELAKAAMNYAEFNPDTTPKFIAELKKIAGSVPRAHWKYFASKGLAAEVARHARAMVLIREGKGKNVKKAVPHAQEKFRK